MPAQTAAVQNNTRAAAPQIMLTYNIRRAVSAAEFARLIEAQACAAVVLYDGESGADEALLQKTAAPLVPLIQGSGAAALIAGPAAGQICGRLKADGLHLQEQNSQSPAELADLRSQYGDSRILGYGNPHNRHTALEAGEGLPDYLFFGALGKDLKPDPHPRNLSLAAWWAEIMQIDCVIQAGADLAALPAALAAKAEFIALEQAIFTAAEPAAALRQAQTLIAAGTKAAETK